MSAATVTALSVTPVKGTRLSTVKQLELEPTGARADRRFFVIDERSRMVNSKQIGELQQVISAYDDGGTLSLTFPDGNVVVGAAEELDPIDASFYSEPISVTLIGGPFSAALSDHVGQPLRLVATVSAVDRGELGAVTLISRGSLERLAAEAGVDSVDARRFRMLIEVDGLAAHAEDRWLERSVRIGDAVVRFEGHVGRCMITSRDPETGVVDLPTLEILRSYRGQEPSMEALPFGIYGRVLQPGRISVGDVAMPL